MQSIFGQLDSAVKGMQGTYDVAPAKARISTALAAGRAEVRLQGARRNAQLRARAFDMKMNTRLA